MIDRNASSHRRSPSVEASGVGDRAVLYHRDTGKALVLNPTGSLLWQSLETERTTHELAEKLQARFPSLTAQQALNDATDFLLVLRDHGVLISETA